MVYRLKDTSNGFVMDSTTTREDLLQLFSSVRGANCIICNGETAKSLPLKPICINKKVEDNVFYINGVY
jgi:hypothetical protein